MIRFIIYSITVVIGVLSSCTNTTGTRIQGKDSTLKMTNYDSPKIGSQVLSVDTVSRVAMSFLDSIQTKARLSNFQIQKNTLIDSIYFTDDKYRARFEGDTVFAIRGGLQGAIIQYDDRTNCLYKFLLVFDSNGHNTDYKKVFSDCDRDESSDYYSLDYKFTSDSTFQILESYMPPNAEKVTKIEKTSWVVNKEGKCEQFNVPLLKEVTKK
jgi:hypothetical protein